MSTHTAAPGGIRALDLAKVQGGAAGALTFKPYWWEAAPRRGASAKTLPGSCDVAIVGSGFTGLSAALTLAKNGRKAVVLDSGTPGYGASTRNGGQIGSGNQKFRVQKLIALRGRQKAEDMLREGMRMLDYIEQLIKDEAIDCHFSRCGRFRGAMRPEHYEGMARDMEDLRKIAGVDSFMVPKSEQHSEIGSDVFFGGSVLPNDASLHPGLYHDGLMNRVEALGGEVIGNAAVTGISREAQGFRVKTALGEISARNVIIATNGYTSGLVPELGRRIVPVGSGLIATAELPADLMSKLLPKNRVYGNTNKVFYYFRGTPGRRRLLWGGRVGRLAASRSPRAYSHLARKMIEVFPELAGAPVSHAWDGLLGFTADEVPHAGRTRDGLYFMLGYSGTGVSRSIYFGHKLALKILDDPAGKTAFDDLAFPDFPAPAVARRMVGLVETWYRLKDAAGI